MVDVAGSKPVLEALRSGQEINRLLVAKGQRQGSIREITALAKKRGVVVQEVERSVLDKLSDSVNHQGVIAQIAEVGYWELSDLLAQPRDPQWPLFLILLDGIQDPHNLGAIIRSAEALGAHGVIIPKETGGGGTHAVMKSSAGAANYCLVCGVPLASTT